MTDKSQYKVILYSTSTCAACMKAKNFFNDNEIDVRVLDVATDQDARKEMIKKSGQMGVPVIEINKDVFIGFNEEALRNALGIKEN